MQDVIALLPDHVANQIAAGEVVQRPASVVKELLENAIDAKATSIQLIVGEAGKQRIQVVDNGMGMSATDARMAFERHATSKINNANDLFALHTKGFRGEALASIAAVAHVEMHSRRAQDDLATKITMAGSEVVDQSFVVSPVGTSLSVTNLFYNVPARRNFLKSNQVELRHIIDEFHRVALAHPDIAFQLINGGNELFDLPAENLKRRIFHVFGRKIEDKLVPIDEQTPVANIRGFVLKPDAAKRTRGMQFFFVNQRFVKSPFLHHAIKSAFEGLMHEGMHPGYFLFIDLDPNSIDINIHPTKTEIKFENEQSIFAILKSTVKHSLGVFQIAPTLDFDHRVDLEVPHSEQTKSVAPPQIQVDRDFNPFSSEKQHTFQSQIQPKWEALYQEIGSTEGHQESLLPDDAATETLAQQKFFQLMRRYVVTATGNSLLLLDQERAHQRILYEQFLATITQSNSASQQLLFPLEVEMSPLQSQQLSTYTSLLEEVGFKWNNEKGNTISIVGIPNSCSEPQALQVFDDLFSSLTDDAPKDTFEQTDHLAKILCKTLGIKRGKELKEEEQQRLIDDLFACKDSQVSPFNRQIFITLTQEELQKKFY